MNEKVDEFRKTPNAQRPTLNVEVRDQKVRIADGGLRSAEEGIIGGGRRKADVIG